MSATLDPLPFVKFFGPDRVKVVYIEGRSFPIRILHTVQPSSDYVIDAAITCMQIHRDQSCPPDRGILIFLTGEEEIMRCINLIQNLFTAHHLAYTKRSIELPSLALFPLFASLPQILQTKALRPSKQGVRKVIVCTNIAETSLTIPGIRFVIDCGRVKTLKWDPKTGLESLQIKWISKSQAWQRSGRAGRESSGVCFRLYTSNNYEKFLSHPRAQLLDAPIAGVILNLFAMGIEHLDQFKWLTKPVASAIEGGLDLLIRLNAISSKTIVDSSLTKQSQLNNHSIFPRPLQLTPLGRLMSALPLDPRFARVIISAGELGCMLESITAISMLYVCPIFFVPQERREDFSDLVLQFRHPDGDLIRLVLIYRAYLKAGKAISAHIPNSTYTTEVNSSRASRRSWCRENCLNSARLSTAHRVRTQLKQLVKACNIGRLRSCQEDFSILIRAFFNVAFRDQVAVLNRSKQNCAPYKVSNDYPYYSRVYKPVENELLALHPDSNLYPSAVLMHSPPSAVLYIEALQADIDSDNSPSSNSQSNLVRVLMRYVSVIPRDWLSTTQAMSADPVLSNCHDPQLTVDGRPIQPSPPILAKSKHPDFELDQPPKKKLCLNSNLPDGLKGSSQVALTASSNILPKRKKKKHYKRKTNIQPSSNT